MEALISIGNSQEFGLRRAILIYSSSEHKYFATVHEIARPAKDKPVELGPAALLSTVFIQDLIKGLGAKHFLEILPENILARNEVSTAWWTPAGNRVMFFHDSTELAVLTGKHFPIPPLVYKVSNGQLSIRSLLENRRPSAKTKLCHAPFWNVYPDGRICHGSMRVPREFSVTALPAWEKAFFGSNFSHTIRDVLCKHPDGLVGLWKSLAGKKGLFPDGMLKPSGDTLEEMVSRA